MEKQNKESPKCGTEGIRISHDDECKYINTLTIKILQYNADKCVLLTLAAMI